LRGEESARRSQGPELSLRGRRGRRRAGGPLGARAGPIGDPAGKEGAAYLTGVTMPLGTATRAALAIETAFGDLGTSLNPETQRESTRLGLEVLKRNVGGALELLADVVRHPTFPEAE